VTDAQESGTRNLNQIHDSASSI